MTKQPKEHKTHIKSSDDNRLTSFTTNMSSVLQKIAKFANSKRIGSDSTSPTGAEQASSRLTISSPVDVKHQCHVAHDARTGTLTGLPPEWQKWLEGSIRLGWLNFKLNIILTF